MDALTKLIDQEAAALLQKQERGGVPLSALSAAVVEKIAPNTDGGRELLAAAVGAAVEVRIAARSGLSLERLAAPTVVDLEIGGSRRVFVKR